MKILLRRPRGAIALAMLLAAAVASAAVGAKAYYHRLPDPATADREGLFRWLVLRDLAAEPDAVQRILLARLQDELRLGVELSQVNDRIDADRQARFWRNVDHLLEQFFLQKTAAFHALPPAERAAFVRAEIDELLTWEYVKSLRAQYAGQSGDSGLLAACEARIAPWRANASPASAAQMNDLLAHIKADLMLRALQGRL